MKGITGEDNCLRFEPRNYIAIGEGDLLSQMKALIAISAAGARAVVSPDSELAKYQSRLVEYLYVTELSQFNNVGLMVVLSPISAQQKINYAERDGQILTYVENLSLALSVFPLIYEKSISVNTTAAGGNTSLMAEVD